MKLNTYRCGCGRIETLPNLKARPPQECPHNVIRTGHEYGPWRDAPYAAWPHAPGWTVQERNRRGAQGDMFDLIARKPKHRDQGFCFGAEIKRGDALNLLAGLARKEHLRVDRRRQRAERSLAAIGALVKKIRFHEWGKLAKDVKVTIGGGIAAPGFTEGVRQLDPKTFVSRKPAAPENHKQADHILGNALQAPASWAWQRVRGLWVCRIQFMYETDEDAWINSESKLWAYNTIRQIVPDFHVLLDPPKYPSRET